MRLVRLLEAAHLVRLEPQKERADGVGEVLRLRDADDRRAHDRLREEPGERHLGSGHTARSGNLRHSVDDRAITGTVQAAAELVRLAPGGLLVPVTGEPPAGERAPRDRADTLVGTEREHLALLLPVEEVVVVLHADEA